MFLEIAARQKILFLGFIPYYGQGSNNVPNE